VCWYICTSLYSYCAYLRDLAPYQRSSDRWVCRVHGQLYVDGSRVHTTAVYVHRASASACRIHSFLKNQHHNHGMYATYLRGAYASRQCTCIAVSLQNALTGSSRCSSLLSSLHLDATLPLFQCICHPAHPFSFSRHKARHEHRC
jgi:hypothetical protein